MEPVYFDFIFNESSLTKSILNTLLKNHFLKKVTCNQVASIIVVGFVLWVIYYDFVCEFQKYLVISIFRTFRNY